MIKTDIFLKELTELTRKYRLSIRGGNFHGLPCLTQLKDATALNGGKYSVNSELENLKFSLSDTDQDSSERSDKTGVDASKFLKELTVLTRKYGLIIKVPENGATGTVYLAKMHDPWTIYAGEYTVDDNLKYLSYGAPHCG